MPQLWWYVARASGVVAWTLAAASIAWGLALSGRALGKKPAGPWLLDLHRFLGALTVVFTAVHLGALVADTYTHWGLADLLVPLATGWKPLPVALGIVALYLLVAIEVTSLLMRQLPRRLWRAVHATSVGLYALATVHLLTAGTDAANPFLRGAVLGSIGVSTFLLTYRLATRRRGSRVVRLPARAAA